MERAWRLSAGDEHTVFDENECKLVSVSCGGMSGRTFDEATKCAALIASSPQVLGALERLVNVLEGGGVEALIYDEVNEAYEHARTVAAKARGETVYV